MGFAVLRHMTNVLGIGISTMMAKEIFVIFVQKKLIGIFCKLKIICLHLWAKCIQSTWSQRCGPYYKFSENFSTFSQAFKNPSAELWRERELLLFPSSLINPFIIPTCLNPEVLKSSILTTRLFSEHPCFPYLGLKWFIPPLKSLPNAIGRGSLA